MTANAYPQLQITPLDIDEDTDIVRLFQHFADQPYAMLLDSANSHHKNSHFDIMVANPIGTIVSKGGNCEVIDCLTGERTRHSNQSPLSLLQTTMAEKMGQYAQPQDPTLHAKLPFKVGVLGLFGYDLGRQFEVLPQHADDGYSTPDMAVGLYCWSVIKDVHEGKFYLCQLSGYDAPNVEELVALAQRPALPSHFVLTDAWQANLNKGQYVDKLHKIDEYLRAGDCYQVNMAQRFTASYQGDPWHAYCELRDANQAPFSAYLKLDNSTVLSISPERFLAVKSGRVETKPIKGTRPRHGDAEKDAELKHNLAHSDKDRAENLMIVDLLRNDLSKNCLPDSVNVPDLFKVESFPAVHHLVSTVTGQLAETVSPLALLQGAFPGGSITGAPKIRAMEIIDELEPHRRNVYCGSIGYVGIDQDMDTSICIRTLLCEQNQIHCWAGGGIVLDSEPDAEYQESLDKVAKILPILSQCQ